ncbi:hypothetical protein M409DRAFT_38017 [Zasmidium cellare ATCC 36951]|uniref:NmrA-like domain-containing protein n=1 Tax=Zasmidium cellare ATCC 36951 TaxID=1080233 RepID=A0A6A6BZZ9_ZASCE|nr:uncharacterized protein M409DRAFT_38017 [Zasmidium cellare ATCC 36951]KAF2159016.1 hypothetical protein M409DRAFT_38017 [Zasmidium cellare ATCC 36951]
MSKLIVVTGVTGTQGSSVAETFLSLPGWRVRGITRNPSGKAATALAESGVEIVEGDLDDLTSLQLAFADANVVFCNTDFFGHLFQAVGTGHPQPLKHAYDREVQQGVNIAQAAATSKTLKTLELFVFSALPDGKKWSNGKYTHFYHFDSKVDVVKAINDHFPDLAEHMSLLHIGHYVENWKSSPLMAPGKDENGTYVFKRTFSPDFAMPFIVASKDTGPYVKALVGLPPGQNIFAVSEYMKLPDWVRQWGDVLGVKAKYQQVSDDEFFEGAPPAFKQEFVDNFHYVEDFGYTGGDPDIKTLDQIGVGVSVTSMKDYFKGEDWSSVL